MTDAPLLTVVIPAFNEADSLRTLLPQVLSHCRSRGYALIVVNDGSADDTAGVLAAHQDPSLPFAVVTHKLNQGYGAAIKAGIRRAESSFVVTMDADGQHALEDVDRLLEAARGADADLVVGARQRPAASRYRSIGKWLIRRVAALLMPLGIRDLNSGMKLYSTELAKKYLKLCPGNMAYSDVIALVFISQRHRVIERPINVQPRVAGRSTVSTRTAFDTLYELISIVLLFNPMKVFLPLALGFIVAGGAWGLPIVLAGRGISVGAMLAVTTGLIFLALGLLAEQISLARKQDL